MKRKIIAHFSIAGAEVHSKELTIEIDDRPEDEDEWTEWGKGTFYRALYCACKFKQTPEEDIRIEWIKEESK